MTSIKPWNPSSIQLHETNVHHINQKPAIKQVTFRMNDQYLYHEDISVDDIMLNGISSSLMSMGNVKISTYDQKLENIPRIHTYVSIE